MNDKINKIQGVILVGFVVFYGGSLAVNAVMAVFGKATLAVWHWPLFYLTAQFCICQIPEEDRARITAAARHVTKGVATTMLFVFRRAVRSLAALFIKSRTTQTKEA